MTAEEKNIIKTLVENLKHVEGEALKRDKKAEKALKDGMSHVEGAEYYLAQTIVAQQELIRRLQDRVSKYEEDAPKITFASMKDEEEENPSGFLKTAAETAATIAGGAVLSDAIATVSDDLGYEESYVDEDEEDYSSLMEDDLDDYGSSFRGNDEDL